MMVIANALVGVRMGPVLRWVKHQAAALGSQLPCLWRSVSLSIPYYEYRPLNPHKDESETTAGTSGRQHKLGRGSTSNQRESTTTHPVREPLPRHGSFSGWRFSVHQDQRWAQDRYHGPKGRFDRCGARSERLMSLVSPKLQAVGSRAHLRGVGPHPRIPIKERIEPGLRLSGVGYSI